VAEFYRNPTSRENQSIIDLASRPAAVARFWAKIRKEEGGCWAWMAAKGNKGYGAFGIGGSTFKAHRIAFILSGGVIPSGRCLLHSCDNPPCCNPDHLTVGTKADNNADMIRKGRKRSGATKTPVKECRYERGANHHAAKMTPELVRALRSDRAAGMSTSRLGRKYGINGTAARKIATRKL